MKPENEDFRITWIGLCLNLFLGVVKTLAGWLLGSKALIADGMHSLLDLLSDMMVLFGLNMAQRPEDANHHYGHHKFVSMAKFFIGGMLLVFSGLLVYTSIMGLRTPSTGVLDAKSALVFAVISIILKEILFWWTRSIAMRLRSDLILANAWHHRLDSLSSIGVAAALGGVWLGGESWYFLDGAVTLVLACYLVYEGGKIFLRACDDLLDAAPDQSIIEDLREHILPVVGAVAYHDFRVRRVGDVYEIDLHLQVDPNITVDAGHEIAREVKKRLQDKHPEVVKVLVHVEPAHQEHVVSRGISDQET